VAGNNRELFDVYRGVAVVGHDLFRDQDRVFEVITIPGHEGDQHVLTQGEFAQIGRCAIGQDIATSDMVATLDDRTLVDVGVLVGTGVLDEVVDIDAHFTGDVFVVVDANHHTL